ncbi:MAG: DUF3848 domain-containing protein [Blautia sp.]|nr:DUF3848 domain-containing protein [Blautia sp.]
MDNRELLKNKMELEYKLFCRKLMEQEKTVIIQSAYKVNCMKKIIDTVTEAAKKWPEEDLSILIIFPDLLEYLYRRWTKEADSFSVELGRCIRRTAGKLIHAYVENTEEAAS